MKLVAALSWWDEPPELLQRCITAVARVADAVVALDGAYARYPDGTPASPPDQAEAIRDAAADAGIPSLVLAPAHLWAGQCAKRTALMNLAASEADWVATVDADWIVDADPETVRNVLSSAHPLIACYTVAHYMAPGDTVPTRWARDLAGQTEPVAHLWRASAAPFRVGPKHWYVTGDGPSGRGWLWGGGGNSDDFLTRAFPGEYRIVHRALQRDELRARRNRAYCNDRETVVMRLSGQEDDRPDLPRPVFDFDSLAV